jgi:N-formylglutamate amidohydrolase
MKPFFITAPHSGETVPTEAIWLQGLDEPMLFRDVDRFVDQLYQPAITSLQIPLIKAEIHRYVVDLNRVPDDIDAESVDGAVEKTAGGFASGFHWVKTTFGERLMTSPMPASLHKILVQKYYQPFHSQVQEQYQAFRTQGFKNIFQLDAHSMPSKGTAAHRDQGAERPQIVVSDLEGKSCMKSYADLVKRAFDRAGFQVAYNWPYKGGRITEAYGQPQLGQHVLQVELNRKLYMNEDTKRLLPELAPHVQVQLQQALTEILEKLPE